MKILLCAISGKFPMWEFCVKENMKLVDRAIFRIDVRNLDRKETEKIVKALPENAIYFLSDTEPGAYYFRMDLITALHDQNWPVEYVLFPDEDEVMPDITYQGDGQLMFDYEMITEGHTAFKYPALRHAKAFKYNSKLSYIPYYDCARIGLDGCKLPEIKVTAKVRHYCFFKKEWEETKRKSIMERYPDYFRLFPPYYPPRIAAT